MQEDKREDSADTQDAISEGVTASYQPSLRESIFSLLFVTPKSISVAELSELIKTSQEEVQEELKSLIAEIDEAGLGIEIKIIGENYQLRTKAHMAKTVQRMITPKMKRLSKAAAETLAIVAYKQPVSKAEIEAIRGVDALPTLKTLLDGRLIRIVGREDTPGSPALYGTTDFFLERFGLKDLSQLPTVREIKELDAEISEIESDEIESFAEQDINLFDESTAKLLEGDFSAQDEPLITDEEFANLDPENTTNH